MVLSCKVAMAVSNMIPCIFFRFNYVYEKHSYSHLKQHLLWTLPIYVFMLVAVILNAAANYRFNDFYGDIVSYCMMLYTMFAIGSALGGFLWMLLAHLMAVAILLLFDLLDVRTVFGGNIFTTITFLSRYGVLISHIITINYF